MSKIRVALVGLFLVPLVACTGQKEVAATPLVANVASAATVACGDGVSNKPPADALVADGVFVPTVGLVPEPSGRVVPPLFAKTGLWVRAERAARLTVTDPAGAGIGWGSSAGPTDQVVVPACDRSDVKWLVWPGGFWLLAPACVTLRVEAGHDVAVVRVPVGTPCG